MSAVQYASVAAARANLKRLLDAAAKGDPSHLRRDEQQLAIVDGERLRHYLAALLPHAQIAHEAGSWWIYLPGTSISADGATLNEALYEAVVALREYAADWSDHLSTAVNHAGNWGLVQLIALSSDDQLAEWLSGR